MFCHLFLPQVYRFDGRCLYFESLTFSFDDWRYFASSKFLSYVTLKDVNIMYPKGKQAPVEDILATLSDKLVKFHL